MITRGRRRIDLALASTRTEQTQAKEPNGKEKHDRHQRSARWWWNGFCPSFLRIERTSTAKINGVSHAGSYRLFGNYLIGRSWLYYRPRGETPLNLALMRLIDAVFLDCRFYGVRHLRRPGHAVGRKRVSRLLAKMGLAPFTGSRGPVTPIRTIRSIPPLPKDLEIRAFSDHFRLYPAAEK